MNNYLPLLAGCLSPLISSAADAPKRPNIIYILADDLGYADIGCYGQRNFQTPNIDRLAAEGVRMTQHYSGSTVSAPSRSALMTGLHTGHTPIRGNKELKGEGQTPMPDSLHTLPKLLRQAGYTTGAFGKWGLGMPNTTGDPKVQGFDVFYGYNCQRMAHRYYPPHIWHNDQQIMLEGNAEGQMRHYAPDLIHDKLLEFIKQNKQQPFFAYVPLIQPHAELLVPDDEILASVADRYPETPFVNGNPGATYGSELFSFSGGYCSQPKPRATFAAMVMRIDRYVGEIMALLKELGMDENTLIIFSSDNGPHLEGGADPDFFDSNGAFRGYKRDLSDGGIRVPMIARWSSQIAAGTTSEHISAFWDVLPTLTQVAGAKTPTGLDGISFLPTLLGQADQPQHEYLYWQFIELNGRRAVRYGNWKAVQYNVFTDPNAPICLYDITTDSEELQDVAAQHPDVIAKVKAFMEAARTPNTTYPFQPAGVE